MWLIEKLDEVSTEAIAVGSIITSALMLGSAGAYVYFLVFR